MSPKDPSYYASDRSDFLNWLGGNYERVLDVGCGTGANEPWFRKHKAREIVGIEIDPASAAAASTALDHVICAPVESGVDQLAGTFDLIVCADVLEHLVDPWAIVGRLREFAAPHSVLAISMPNIRFLPALARIAVGRGFDYDDHGIFDSTHLRFFTRGNMEQTLRQGGWSPERWGAPTYRRLGTARRLLQRATSQRSDEWLAVQLFVAARPSDR